MKQHTVKVEATKNGKITEISLNKSGETSLYKVSKKGKVFEGNKLIGHIKRARMKWYDNQFILVFENSTSCEK